MGAARARWQEGARHHPQGLSRRGAREVKTIIPPAADRHNLIALGKTRSGKSSKLRVLTEGQLDRGEPVCIIDPKGDWWGLKSSADGKTAGYPIVIFGGEHADVPINEHS